MMMRYHHFLGIGHTYSNAFRTTNASTSSQDTMETHNDGQNQDQDVFDLPLATQAEFADLSDTDSINTVDNGWQGWDEGEEDDNEEGYESDGELLEMDNMYGR
jgi:hypothetical protein